MAEFSALPPVARLLKAAILLRRAAASATETARLLGDAYEEIRRAQGGLPENVPYPLTAVVVGVGVRLSDAQAAASRLPTLADALGKCVAPAPLSGDGGGAS